MADILVVVEGSAKKRLQDMSDGTWAEVVTQHASSPDVSVLGATTGAAVVTDATGTIQQYLRGLVKLIVSKITVGIDQTTPGTTNAVVASKPSVTQVVSTALEASKVLKASAGSLVSLTITNTKTSAQWILLMNSTTVPGNGTVTLLYPPIAIGAGETIKLDWDTPLVASTGIAVANSSTGTFTLTVGSADCVFHAQVI